MQPLAARIKSPCLLDAWGQSGRLATAFDALAASTFRAALLAACRNSMEAAGTKHLHFT